MNNHYIKEELPDNICKAIDNILKVNNIHDIFDYNLWIAGGFPRIIQYIRLNNLDPKKVLHNYFYNTRGDIDVFASKKDDVGKFFRDKHSKCTACHTSAFAINMLNSYDLITNVQIVNAFFYNTYEDCLDAFDFTNCKYLLYKKKGKYMMLKDKRADFFTKERLLNIDICASPLLSHRIIKYFNKHKIQHLSDSKETRASIDNYLFKVLADDWDNKFTPLGDLNEIADVYIKKMHNRIKLSSDQLSILVGKFSESIYAKRHYNGSYGVYLEHVGETDWASKEIQNNFIQQR